MTIAFVASISASPIFFGAQLRALTASLANYKENLVQKLDTVTKSGSGDSVIGRAVASIKFVDKALRADTRRARRPEPARHCRRAHARMPIWSGCLPFFQRLRFWGSRCCSWF